MRQDLVGRARRGDSEALGELAVVVLLVLFAGTVAVVGAVLLPRSPHTTGPASNGLIAFAADGKAGPALERADVDPRTADRDIYVVGNDGRVSRIVGTGHDGIAQSCPAFSLDGRFLAYRELDARGLVPTMAPVPAGQTFPPGPSEAGTANWSVVILRLDPQGAPTGEVVRIRIPDAAQSNVSCPIWAADSRRLAYTTDPEKDVWVISLDAPPHRIPAPPNDVNDDAVISWSPDGRTVAYAYDDRLWFLPVDGDAKTSTLVGETESMSWSPDGSRLLLFGQDAFHVTTIDGHELVTIPTPDSRQAAGFWSPDGRQFALVLDGRVVLVSADAGTRGEVPIDQRSLPGQGVRAILTWSPDGTRLLVTSGASVDSNGLYSVPLDPGQPTVVLVPPTLALGDGASWQPIRP